LEALLGLLQAVDQLRGREETHVPSLAASGQTKRDGHVCLDSTTSMHRWDRDMINLLAL
jgi:hypothetical protein